MGNSTKNAVQSFFIDGEEQNAPIEWQDITITAEFVNDSIQPTITIESLNFTLGAREKILEWISRGKIFEGIPLGIKIYNNQTEITFQSLIDLTKSANDRIQDGVITTAIIRNDLDSLFSKIELTTFGYLESIGKIRSSDYQSVPYIVQKRFNILENVMTLILIYLITKELKEAIKNTADSIAIASGLLSAGITGSIGATIYAIAAAIISIAYSLAMIIAVISLTQSMIEGFIPPQREHKAINLRRALQIVTEHFGYILISPIGLLDKLFYLPSNNSFDTPTALGFIKLPQGTRKGIPNQGDYGYNCSEMFDLCRKMFQAKFSIIGNELHLRAKNDPYWKQTSTYKKPRILNNQKEYNTNELNGSRLFEFEVDQLDDYTIENYNGTTLEIRTELTNVSNQQNNLLKGYDEIKYFVALGNRKDELNPFENVLKSAATIVDSLTSVLGGKTNFAAKISTRVGMLMQSQNTTSKPKILYLTGGKLPKEHRSLFNAEVLYDQYQNESSFVQNNYGNQKEIYKNPKVPFGLEDFIKVLQNGYFDENGLDAGFIKFAWKVNKDYADIDYFVKNPYTTNLIERKILP